MHALEIEEKLKAHFPDAHVTAAAFEGKSLVVQHQLVYKALGDWMQGPIHALALTTHIPKN